VVGAAPIVQVGEGELMSETQSASRSPQPGSIVGTGIAKGFWSRWILLTTLGYAAGLGVDEALYGVMGTALSGIAAGVANVALYGAIVGGASGALQALLLRHRIERAYLWVPASMAGGAVGFVLGTVAAEAASNSLSFHVPSSAIEVINQILYGALCGASIGVAQRLLIRGGTGIAGAWVPANIVGLMIGCTTALLWVVLQTPFRYLLGSTIGSIIPGAIEVTNLPFLAVWLGASIGLLLGVTQWLWARSIARVPSGR